MDTPGGTQQQQVPSMFSANPVLFLYDFISFKWCMSAWSMQPRFDLWRISLTMPFDDRTDDCLIHKFRTNTSLIHGKTDTFWYRRAEICSIYLCSIYQYFDTSSNAVYKKCKYENVGNLMCRSPLNWSSERDTGRELPRYRYIQWAYAYEKTNLWLQRSIGLWRISIIKLWCLRHCTDQIYINCVM